MALNYPRASEVDTPEEVAKAFRQVIDEIKAIKETITSSDQMPPVGKVVAIKEDEKFYAGTVTEHHDDGTFEIEFFDGDDGCYGVDDLACNETKGAKDA